MAGPGEWRYIAQRVTGDGNLGEFIDFNLPLQEPNLDEVLSGHNGLTGQIAPEIMRLKGPDGEPVLSEWGAAIWAEDPDGEIRGGGIINHCNFEGPNWSIECIDLSGVMIDMPYMEDNYWVNVDPIDLFREVWRHMQTQRGSNFGVTIDPTRSPVRLGTDLVQYSEFDLEPDPSVEIDPDLEEAPVEVAPNRYATNADWRAAGVKAMKRVGWNPDVVDEALKLWLNKDRLIEEKKWPKGGLTDRQRTIRDRAIEKIGWPPSPPNPGRREMAPAVVAPAATPVPGGEPGPGGGLTLQYDAYKLSWFKDHNLASTIDDLATNTPFDWVMTHKWVDDEIRHHIRIGYPRIGRRRDELRFVVGENIKVLPSIERDGSIYASEVLFLGAGEGAAMVTGRAFRHDPNRVRKVAVISDPSVTDPVLATNLAQAELNRRFNLENVASVVLEDHPHAPIGSVDLGDEILVEGETGWVDLEVWCRVIGRSMAPQDGNRMVLDLIRTDRL